MPSKATATRIKTATEEIPRLGDPIEAPVSLPTELRRLMHDQLQLAALELRLAGRGLMAMLAAAVLTGALLLLAWVALLASAGLGLDALGLPPAMVLLVLAALTMALALLLITYIYHRSRDLGFPGTVRSLKPSAEKTREPEAR